MRARRLPALLLLFAVVAALASGCGSSPAATPEAQTSTAETVGPALVTAEPSAVPPSSASTPAPTSAVDVALEYIQRIEDRPLARVNGQEIFWEDYEPSLRQALRIVSRQGNVNWNDPAMQQRLGQLQNEVLRQTADRWLVRQMAEAQGITFSQADVEAELEKEKAEILEAGYYQDWESYLAANGFTAKSAEQALYDTMLLMALMETQQVDTEAEQVHLAHIVVSDTETAQTVVDRLKAGEDFADLAREYSEDEQTKDEGGDLGWFSYELMLPELAQPARVIPAGQWSDPIMTRHGYTIIMILDRQVREADPALLQQRRQKAFTAQLEGKRAEAQIEYLVDFTQGPN